MNELPSKSCWWGVLLLVTSVTAAAQMTEVPSTATRGKWLLEVDAASVAYDRHTPYDDGVRYRSSTYGSMLMSTGLTDKLDLQFGYDLWHEETATGAGVDERYSGRGDVWLRSKWNFAGDESTGPAWALLSYVKVPTAAAEVGNDSVEPGMILVFGSPWGDKRTVTANLGLDWVDDGNGGRNLAGYLTGAITYTLTDSWSAYAEYSFWTDWEDTAHWWGQLGAGVIRGVGERGWVDLVVYAGITKAAPDVMPLLRFGWQF